METEHKIEQPHSTEISISSKGLWSGKVKVYASDIDTAYNMAIQKAELLEDHIKLKNKLDGGINETL